MARENRRLGFVNTSRGLIVAAWVIFSSVFYGAVCLLICPFSLVVARRIARVWSDHLLAVGGVKIKVRGMEKLDKNKRYVFIANHQSGLDIPVLYTALNRTISFIAKKELFFIPIFGWGMAAVGHIWIDRSNARKARQSIIRAINHLRKASVSLVLFPEGTRSEDGKVAEFKKGSFSLALQSGVQAVPVVIHDSRNCLPKGYSLVVPGIIHIDICDPIELNDAEMSKADVSVQIRNIICDVAAKGPQKQ